MSNNKNEIVKVKHPDGYMVINKEDFDKSKHELYEEKKVIKKAFKKKIKKEEK